MNFDALRAIASLDTSASALEYAGAYVRAGLGVLPLHSVQDGTCNCPAAQTCAHPGKHPRVAKGVHAASVDIDQLRRWFGRWPDSNVAIAVPETLVVVDIDDPFTGHAALKSAGFELPRSLEVRTGRGTHIYYQAAQPVRSRTGVVPRVDVRGVGGYIIVPPSRHALGGGYTFANDEPIAVAPPWLYSQPNAERASAAMTSRLGYDEGFRDVGLFRDACSFRARGLSIEQAETLIVAAANACRPPFPVEGALEKVRRAYRFPASLHPLTDSGNAERLIALFGDYIRYVPGVGWMVWDDCRWNRDEADHVLGLTKDVARAIRTEADQIADDEQRRRTLKWAKLSESRARREAMRSLAAVEQSVVVSTRELDRDHYLLNVRNGTIELRSGVIRPHDARDLITRIANVEYDPAAECPTFISFLNTIFDSDADLIAFLQRFTGYALTGDTSEHALVMLYGTGANGKTTFIEALASIAGDYAMQANLETFTTDRGSSSASNHLARLRGARIVFRTELNAGARLAEATVKQVTGGDTISARFLYQEFFEFRPAFKLFMASNYKPHVSTDDGIWRRIRLVPFAVTIPADERDARLPERLLAESSGILNWALKGTAMWLASGLGSAAAVAGATAEYRDEMDRIGDFIASSTIAKARIGAGELYQAYVAFASSVGEEPVNQRRFGSLLSARGIQRARASKARFYAGIRLVGGIVSAAAMVDQGEHR